MNETDNGKRDSEWLVDEWLVEALRPQPGQTILELAAGDGDTGDSGFWKQIGYGPNPRGPGFLVAEKLGEDGKLISSDLSPAMVEKARRRAQELGIENAEFRVIDARAMDLDSGSVDGILCRYGYMLMRPHKAALAETRRVLRPGGRLAFSVWGPTGENLWMSIPAIVAVQLGIWEDHPRKVHKIAETRDPDAGGTFSLAEEERIRDLLEGAGFSDVTLERIPMVYRYGDVGERIALAIDAQGELGTALRDQAPDVIEDFKKQLTIQFEPFKRSGGYEFPALALAVAAT